MTGLNSVVQLFEEKQMVKVCAPMVRYSRLEFRTLVRKYNCDLCFTPMIMADSFVKSADARANDFKTNDGDRPLIVQFGANNLEDFVSAAQMVAPYSDGVDLNCGCPQRWAMKDGYGSALLYKPELVKDMVRQLRERIPKPFSISVKIRLLAELKKTVDLCKTLEACGATFLTVHGRTPAQRNEPVNIEAFREIRQSVSIPLVANGDVKTLQDAEKLQQLTGYNGVMSARGILQNPALFGGHEQTPVSCIEDWLDITLSEHLPFMIFHNHLVFMVEKIMKKADRRIFNNLRTTPSVVKFLQDHFDIKVPSWYDPASYNELTAENKYKPDGVPNKLSIIDQNIIANSVISRETSEKPIEVYLNNSCKIMN